MATTVLTRGSEWSSGTLHDGWGDNVTDEQVTRLGKLVITRFEELAEDAGYAINWFPSLSEVHGDAEAGDSADDCHIDDLDDLRKRAIDDVWNAVIGNGGPMQEAVNEIFREDDNE